MKDGILKNGELDSDDERTKSVRNKKQKKKTKSQSKDKKSAQTDEWLFICNDDA